MEVPHRSGNTSRSRRVVAVTLAVVLALVFASVYLSFVTTAWGQESDVVAFARAQRANAWLEGPASLVRRSSPLLLGLLCFVLALLAAWRRQWRSLLAAAVLVPVSVALSYWLRDIALERPDLGDFGYEVNTFPSRNVAATVSLAWAAVILWPTNSRWRWLAAGAVAILACAASVIGHAHRPSDVVGSLLMVGALAAIVHAITTMPSRKDVHTPAPRHPN